LKALEPSSSQPLLETVVESPTGTLTFLFTDLEGSSRLWEERPEETAALIAHWDALLREAVEAQGGHVFKSMGDTVCAAFPGPAQAVRATVEVHRRLKDEGGRMKDEAEPGSVGSLHPSSLLLHPFRMAVHAGEAD